MSHGHTVFHPYPLLFFSSFANFVDFVRGSSGLHILG